MTCANCKTQMKAEVKGDSIVYYECERCHHSAILDLLGTQRMWSDRKSQTMESSWADSKGIQEKQL